MSDQITYEMLHCAGCGWRFPGCKCVESLIVQNLELRAHCTTLAQELVRIDSNARIDEHLKTVDVIRNMFQQRGFKR